MWALSFKHHTAYLPLDSVSSIHNAFAAGSSEPGLITRSSFAVPAKVNSGISSAGLLPVTLTVCFLVEGAAQWLVKGAIK